MGLWILIAVFLAGGSWTAFESARPPPSVIRIQESGLEVEERTIFGQSKKFYPWPSMRPPAKPYGPRGERFVRFVLTWLPPRSVGLNVEPEIYAEFERRIGVTVRTTSPS